MVKLNAVYLNTSEMAGTLSTQSSSGDNSETNSANRPVNLDVLSGSEESLLTDDERLEEARPSDTSNQNGEVRSDSPSNNGTSMELSSSREDENEEEDDFKRYFTEQISKITDEELLGLKEELARLRKSKMWNTYLLACPTIMYVMHELVRDDDDPVD